MNQHNLMLVQDNAVLNSFEIMENTVKIRNVVQETEDAITVYLDKHPSLNHYSSGQFINVFHPIENQIVSRSYSFSSSPETDEWPAITIKRVPSGLLSGYLVDSLRKEKYLTISEPLGRFGLAPASNDSDHLVFIAGGSGITPLFSMIKTALKASPKSKISLFYANKNRSSILFHKQLEVLQRQYEKQFNVTHFIQNGDQRGKNIQKGYITTDFLKTIAAPTTQVYLCGPEAMMETMSRQLEELKFEGKLIKESYTTNKAKEDVSNLLNTKSEITFLRGEDSFKLNLTRNDFILETGLKAGLTLPHSCKEAMCGSCKAKVLSGKIDMKENYALTDSMIDEGYVLLCSGKPASPNITVAYA